MPFRRYPTGRKGIFFWTFQYSYPFYINCEIIIAKLLEKIAFYNDNYYISSLK